MLNQLPRDVKCHSDTQGNECYHGKARHDNHLKVRFSKRFWFRKLFRWWSRRFMHGCRGDSG
ncbi:hypothetical protein HanXRQr2_Chr10g0444411 [Helianthus annuus]|uniref:Uncharacterized protein n=1 Tax=Helianthus annuus TaxID=4232 RepID=A0A251THX5_HELAN|nr:hypothetical protein HanXRQr2_Chr10g0444411 [Helianthus annuus]